MRPSRTPECGHPDRQHHGRGLCRPCHDAARFRGELDQYATTYRPDKSLVQRAEELRAELEAAAEYTGVRVTWRLVAEKLGVKPATLERAQVRARAYARRQVPEPVPIRPVEPDLLDEDPNLFLDEGEVA